MKAKTSLVHIEAIFTDMLDDLKVQSCSLLTRLIWGCRSIKCERWQAAIIKCSNKELHLQV